MINGGAQGTMRLDDFARTFMWADDKYPIQTGLREMVDEIMTVRQTASEECGAFLAHLEGLVSQSCSVPSKGGT